MFEPVQACVVPAALRSGASCLILGGGPTGLSAAYHYGEGSVLLERESKAGGSCRSFEDTGFTFDHAGHVMFSNDPYVQDLYRLLLGDNVHWQEREAWIHGESGYARYPFQSALHGLPARVLRECLVGAIEARFGSLTPESDGGGRDDAGGEASDVTEGPKNFEEFVYRTWGAGVAKHFALPYNRKLWTVPLTEM
jgi:protoporphyrinogen oxidase